MIIYHFKFPSSYLINIFITVAQHLCIYYYFVQFVIALCTKNPEGWQQS